MIKVWDLQQIIGKQLLEVEYNDSDHSGSGTEEVVLHFTGGKEICIYINDEQNVMVEGD